MLRARRDATYAAVMTRRSWLAVPMVVGFLAVLAHTTAATQCPAREQGACAKVHALMLKPPRVAEPVTVIAAPMPGHATDDAFARPLELASLTR